MSNKERRNLEKLHSSKYVRLSGAWGVNAANCLYCGEIATCLDHAPAISRIEQYSLEDWFAQNVIVCLVPSCTECNALLLDRNLPRVSDRCAFIAKRLGATYERKGVWRSEDELAEFGQGLVDLIRASKARWDFLLRRAREAEQRSEMCELLEPQWFDELRGFDARRARRR
jgi:hypothetical protein